MKKFSKIALSFILVMAISTSLFSIGFASSDDSYEGYTPISSITDLYNIRNNLDGKYVLTKDIDLLNFFSIGFDTPFEEWSPTNTWVPIGTSDEPFTGVLDGNGHCIENMIINIKVNETDFIEECWLGLFGVVVGAEVKNIEIKNIDINIDYPYEVSFPTGAVSGLSFDSEILNCKTSGNINAILGGGFDIGGIVGRMYATEKPISVDYSYVKDCFSSVNITIVGKDESMFSYPVSYRTNIGGIVGSSYENCKIYSSYFNGTINATPLTSGRIGGILGIGLYNAPVIDCGNVGNIKADGNRVAYVGGICGESHTVKNCFNAGTLETTDNEYSKIGGIAGKTEFIADEESKKHFNAVDAEIENCYFLNDLDNAVSNEAEGKITNTRALSDDEMKNQDSYVGFDFEYIWSMSENGYPIPIKKTVTEDETIEIISCEIIDVPLRNRFCTSENISPEGISIKLIYSNNSEVTHKIICDDGKYYVADEEVKVSVENNRNFGIVKVNLSLLDTVVTYKCFAFPAIISIIIDTIVSIFNR